VVSEDISWAFGLAAVANHLCIWTFFSHMGQMCLQTLHHMAAVFDTRCLLNIACTSVSQGIIVRVYCMAVVRFTVELNFVKSVYEVFRQLFEFKNVPTIGDGTHIFFRQIRSGTTATKAVAAVRMVNRVDRKRLTEPACQFIKPPFGLVDYRSRFDTQIDFCVSGIADIFPDPDRLEGIKLIKSVFALNHLQFNN
jgi:hypothetical protein